MVRGWRLLALTFCVAPLIAACATNSGTGVKRAAFTSKEFGVAVSPRVTKAKFPPHGGGRALPNRPYVVRGTTYAPVAGPGYVATGEASWYGQDFHGRRTANGEIFGAYYLTAASPVLPIPSYARVTNLENGRSVMVRINDRGPYLQGRVADVSYETANVLGFLNKGSAQVQVAYVGPAPLNGDDSRMLMASLSTTTPQFGQQGETRIALADTGRQGSTSRDPFSGGLVGDIASLFGYAEGPGTTTGALDAANALAATATPPADTAPAVHIELGTFTDQIAAISITEQFAMLGAVDEDATTVDHHAATTLTLTHLKPGVGTEDVANMAHQLGLTIN